MRAIPPLLRENRDFRMVWLGQTVSLVGDQVSLIAIPLTAVLVLHAGAAQMGYLTAAGYLPNLIFSLHAGAWLDRRGHRRRAMIGADVGRALLVATIPLASAFGALTIGQLYVVAFLVGTLSVLFYVAYATLFVTLVPRDDYISANSLMQGSRALSYVGGPTLGGVLVQLMTAPIALLVDAFSFLASAFALARIHPEEPPTEEAERGHVSAGARWILASPTVRSTLAATATINFFNFVFFSLFILYATNELGVTPGLLGLVIGAGAVGGVIGAIVSGRLSRRIGVGPAFLLGCILFPAPFLLVPLAGGPRPVVLTLLFLSEFGTGFGVMILDIAVGSIFAALIPDRLRSRVSGAYMLVNYGVRPIGSLAGGFLGTAIGLRPTLWVAAVGGLTGFLWLLPSPVPRMRTLPEPAE